MSQRVWRSVSIVADVPSSLRPLVKRRGVLRLGISVAEVDACLRRDESEGDEGGRAVESPAVLEAVRRDVVGAGHLS